MNTTLPREANELHPQIPEGPIAKPAKVNFTRAQRQIVGTTTKNEEAQILRARQKVGDFYLWKIAEKLNLERIYAWDYIFGLDDPTQDAVIFRRTWDDGHNIEDAAFLKADLEAEGN